MFEQTVSADEVVIEQVVDCPYSSIVLYYRAGGWLPIYGIAHIVLCYTIEQGADGDFFYVVDKGVYHALIKTKEGEPLLKVFD